MPRDPRLPDLLQDLINFKQTVDASISFGTQNISHSLQFKDWGYEWWDIGGNWCTPRLGLRPLHTKVPSSSLNSYNAFLNLHGDLTSEVTSGYGIETLLPEWCDANTQQDIGSGQFVTVPQANTYVNGVYELTNITYPQLNDKYTIRFWCVPTDTTVQITLQLSYNTTDIHNPIETWIIGPFAINTTNVDLTTLLNTTVSNLGNALASNYILTGGPLTNNTLIIEFNGRMAGIRTTLIQIASPILPNEAVIANNLIIQKLVQASKAISSGGSTSTGLFDIDNIEYRPLATPMFKTNWDRLDVRVYTNYIQWLRDLCNFHGFSFNYALYYVDGNLSLVRENYTNEYDSNDQYNASGWPWNVFKLFEQLRDTIADISLSDFGYYYWGNPIFAKGIDFSGSGMTLLWDDDSIANFNPDHSINSALQTEYIYTGHWTFDPSDITELGYNGKYTKDNFQSMLPNFITPNYTEPTRITYPALTLIKNDYWYTIKPCNPVTQVQTIIDMTVSGFNLSTYNYFSVNGDKSNNGQVTWYPITALNNMSILFSVYGHYDIVGTLDGVYTPGTNFTLDFACMNLNIATIAINFSIDGSTISRTLIGLTNIVGTQQLSYWCPKSPQNIPGNLLYFSKYEFWKDVRTTTAGTDPVTHLPIPATSTTTYTLHNITSNKIAGNSTGRQLTDLLNSFLINSSSTTTSAFAVLTGITTTDTTTVVSSVIGSRNFTDERVAPDNLDSTVWWTNDEPPYTTYDPSLPQAFLWNAGNPANNTNKIITLSCTSSSVQPTFQRTTTTTDLSVNTNNVKANGRHYSHISAIYGSGTPYSIDVNGNNLAIRSVQPLNQIGYSVVNNIPIANFAFYTGNNQQNAIMSTVYETSLIVAIDTKQRALKKYLGAVIKDSLYTGLKTVWADLTYYIDSNYGSPFDNGFITDANQYWQTQYLETVILNFGKTVKDQQFDAQITVKIGSVQGRLRYNKSYSYTPIDYRPIPKSGVHGLNIYDTFDINNSDPVNDAYQDMYSDMLDNAQDLFAIDIDTTTLASKTLPNNVQNDLTIAMDSVNELVPSGNIIYFLITWAVNKYNVSDTDTFKSNYAITKDTDTTQIALVNGYGSTMLVNKNDTTNNRSDSTLQIGHLSLTLNDYIYQCQGQ